MKLKNDLICNMDTEFNMRESDGYEIYLNHINRCFSHVVKMNGDPYILMTDAKGLFDIFLMHLPESARSHYDCHTCRRFINLYGGLVCINDDGSLEPALWGGKYEDDAIPEIFREANAALYKKVSESRIKGVLITNEKILGIKNTGVFNHFSINMPDAWRYIGWKELKEVRAEWREKYKTIMIACTNYDSNTVRQAKRILVSNSLDRSNKFSKVIDWFGDVVDIFENTKNQKVKEALIWKKIINAPTGFTHISGSVVGSLMDDIKNGLSTKRIIDRFNEKVKSEVYQRPDSAPTDANVQRAEHIFEKMDLATALERRYARFEELPENAFIWKPSEKKENTQEKKTGIFSSVVTKEQEEKPEKTDINIDVIDISWKKFKETVLPNVYSMEYKCNSMVPRVRNYVWNYSHNATRVDNFAAITTQNNESANPILKWDKLENRNPFSLYLYNKGSQPSVWGLDEHAWIKINGIVSRPNEWVGKDNMNETAVLFILEGAKDSGYNKHGNALFPETLVEDLHEVRKTIEAYSKEQEIYGYEESSVCGKIIAENLNNDYILTTNIRVHTDLGEFFYNIVRWE